MTDKRYDVGAEQKSLDTLRQREESAQWESDAPNICDALDIADAANAEVRALRVALDTACTAIESLGYDAFGLEPVSGHPGGASYSIRDELSHKLRTALAGTTAEDARDGGEG